MSFSHLVIIIPSETKASPILDDFLAKGARSIVLDLKKLPSGAVASHEKSLLSDTNHFFIVPSCPSQVESLINFASKLTKKSYEFFPVITDNPQIMAETARVGGYCIHPDGITWSPLFGMRARVMCREEIISRLRKENHLSDKELKDVESFIATQKLSEVGTVDQKISAYQELSQFYSKRMLGNCGHYFSTLVDFYQLKSSNLARLKMQYLLFGDAKASHAKNNDLETSRYFDGHLSYR